MQKLIELYSAKYQMKLGCGSDFWLLTGRCFGH